MEPVLFPWIRLKEGAPAPAGVYLKASAVREWLRSLGDDDLAELLADCETWPASESHVAHSVRVSPLDDDSVSSR